MNTSDMTIGIASDHAGYLLKESLTKYLQNRGYIVINFGTNSEASCDYPDYAHPLASQINSGILTKGITICGSGNGISMVVNKYANVRAALCWNAEIASLARAHNDANICSIPSRFVSATEAIQILDSFLTVPFDGGRHQLRVDKIAISKLP